MSDKIREFNAKGINAFRIYLDEIKNGIRNDLPKDFVHKKTLTKELSVSINKGVDDFENKYDMAKYLYQELVVGNPVKNIWSKVGVWSWLSAYYFDLVCPDMDGVRKPGEDYRHILEVSRLGGGWSRFYRHLIASPVRLFAFSLASSRILLSANFYENGDFIEQFASKKEYAGNRTIISVLNRMYFDENNNKAKRGAQTKNRPGTHRRYLTILEQLLLNYDIQTMTDDELISLLPDEFNAWLQDPE